MSNLSFFELSGARLKFARIVFATVFVILALASGSASFAAGPVLYFSDITSGPNSGNTDGAGGLSRLEHGAIVTVWGKNLGSTQGNSRVHVNGAEAAHVYYWENADPETGDSGPADLYAYHRMQEIAFSVAANANDGKGEIYVVVDGVQSNSLEFTVRSGNIYFVKTTGSDSTGDGSWDNPWASVDHDGGSGASSKMSAGDTVYACDGVVEPGGIEIRSRSGTAENPISVIAYPGADYLSRGNGWGIRNYDKRYEYWNFAKIRIETDGGGYYSFLNGRLIGCSITDITYANGSSGAITILRDDGGVKALGNYIYEFGSDDTSKLHHTTYITNRSGSITPAPELGWNYLRDNKAIYGLHVYDEGIAGDFDGTVRIHDNVVVNQKGSGVDIVNVFSMPVEVYNNLFINCGIGPTPPGGGMGTGFAVYVKSSSLTSDIKFYNNTFYGYGDKSVPSTGLLAIRDDFGGTWEWKNNIVVDTKNIPYIASGHTDIPSAASNNIWYNGDDGNPASPPSWDTNPITSGPLFVDPENDDFHLQEDSPAIEAGFNVGSVVARDLDGNPRPMDGDEDGELEYDIGAYEYTGTYVPPPQDTTAPTMPTNLSATAASYSRIDLSWSASTDNVGVTGYRIHRGGTQIATTGDSFYSDTGLSPETTYSYRVAAYDAAGNVSSQSEPASATTPAAPTASLLYVDNQHPDCSDSYSRDETADPDTPWQTIGRAVQTLIPGDILVVKAGIYTEQVVLSSGSAEAYITLQGEPGTILDGTGTSADARGFFFPDASYVRIDTFEVRNFLNSDYDAITILGTSHNIELSNLVVHNSWNGIIMQDDVHDITISDCLVYNTRWGVGFENTAHDIYIDNVTSHSNAAPSSYGNGDGFSANAGTYNILITDSTAYNNLDAGFDITTYNLECINCRSFNNTKYGFRLQEGGPQTLINAVAYGNGWYPLQISSSGTKYIYNSTFVGGDDYGYSVESFGGDGSNSTIRNTIFAAYEIGVFSASLSSVDEDYNLFYSTTGSVGFLPGPNSFEANPLFVDEAADDYHLRAGSPAVDAGTSEISATVDGDCDGIPRPQGTEFDIGAYEWATGELSITTTLLPFATVGSEYSFAMSAVGGAPPYTWSLTAGSLPDGLSLGQSTGIISGTPTQEGSSNFAMRVTDSESNTDEKNLSITVQAVASDLVLLLHFDEGSGGEAYDSSSYGNDATISGANWILSGKIGPALQFNGVDSYVEIPHSDSLNLTDQLTIIAWVKPAQPIDGNVRYIVYKDDLWGTAKRSTGTPYAYTKINDSEEFVVSPSVLPGDTWDHVAYTFDGSVMRVYLNGQLEAEEPHSGNIATSTNSVRIGMHDYQWYWNGSIDEVKIYSRSLTADEISADYNTVSSNVQVLHLTAGWNLVGMSHQPIDPSCASIFGEVAVGSVWGWDGWKNTEVSSVEPLRAYWVATTAPADIQYEYIPVSDTTPDLSAPWNAFAVAAETPLPLPYPDIVGSVWGWDGVKYVRVETTLQPHSGYWVATDTVQTSPPFPPPEPAGDVLLNLELNTQLAGLERESLELGLLDTDGWEFLDPIPPAAPDGFSCYILGGGSAPFKCVARRLSVLDGDAVRYSWLVVAHVPAEKEFTLSWDSLGVPQFTVMTITQMNVQDGMPVGGSTPMSQAHSVSCLAGDPAVLAWRIEATCRARPSQDSDSDLIHDDWERVNFGSITCDASEDSDGDGMNNYAEFMAGTNPRDYASALAVYGLSQGLGDGMPTLSWTSVQGRKYQILFCDSLESNRWFCLGIEHIGTGGTLLAVDELLSQGQAKRFYRICAW